MEENPIGDVFRIIYGIKKSAEAFEEAFNDYRKNADDGQDYDMKIIEAGAAELLRRYDIDSVDKIEDILPEKYKQFFNMFRSVPWDRTVDLISIALKEVGKGESGEYNITEDVIQNYLGKLLKNKIKNVINLW